MSTAGRLLDRYVDGDSPFHRADARTKLVVTLGFILATTTVPPGAWLAFCAMFALVWGAVIVSRLGIARVFLRSLVAAPFVLIALPTVFTKPGPVLFELDLVLVNLTATSVGLAFFASVLLKSWASVTAATILTATTTQLCLLDALKALRMPKVLVGIVSLMYRYLFVLADEAQRLLRARKSRSAGVGPESGGSVVWRAKVTGGMAGALFIRSLDRGERIYLAMLARGYDGRVRQDASPPPGKASIALAAAALALFAMIAAAAQVVW